MPGLANLVRVACATTGTGTLTLGSAVQGFLTPVQAGMTSGAVYSYAIEADYVAAGDEFVASSREVGTGTYTSPSTLTRSVINSTNSNALLDLAGDAQVIITLISTAAGDFSILGTTASTSQTTGALIVAGGVGIGGAFYTEGPVVINDGSAGSVTANSAGDDFVVEGGGAQVGMSILTPDASSAFLMFGSPSNASYGYLQTSYASGVPSFGWYLLSSERFRIEAGVTRALDTTASTSHTTGALVVAGGVGIAGTVNLQEGSSLEMSTQFGQVTSATVWFFTKTRDATNARNYRFLDVGGLTGDANGAGFWRGLQLQSPTITDPTGGANVFPTASIYWTYNSLTAPTTRELVFEAGNLTATTNVELVWINAGVEAFRIAKGTAGHAHMPQNLQNGTYSIVYADQQKHLYHTSGSAHTYTIPANSSVAFVIGTCLTFVNGNGAGIVTIAITTDTMRLAGAGTTGSRSLAANGVATAVKVASTEWIISGTGLS